MRRAASASSSSLHAANPRRKVVFSASRADLAVVDAASPSAVPRIVTLQADVNYFHGHAGRKLAFTSQTEATGPALYVADAIP